MKLRLDGHSLRFRITDEDLNALITGRALKENIVIGENNLCFTVIPGGNAAMAVSCEGSEIKLSVSQDKIRELAGMGRSKEGLKIMQDDLSISLQVDLRKEKRSAA